MEKVEFSNKFKAACDGCRKQKIKCDRVAPTCSTCQRRGVDCVWPKNANRQSEMKRFYDNASGNIHMFKYTKEPSPPIKKPSSVKSGAVLKVIAKLPELVEDSGQETSSPSAILSDQSYTTELLSLYSTITVPRPAMEYMVADYDRILLLDVKDKFGLGKTVLKDNYVVKSCNSLIPNRNNQVRIIGLDYNPIYENVENDYAALSSVLEIHLINLFFNQINTFFPLIHRGKFFNSLKSPKTKPSNFLINAICYIACPMLPFNPMYFLGCHFKLAQIYHQKAMEQLEANLDTPTISAVQAVLLLYNGECAMIDKLNAIQYKLIRQLKFDEIDLASLSKEDQEEMKNLLWSCYLQDKICNLTRCRKFSIPKSQFPLHLPAKMELPALSELFSLPGAQHCQLAFIGSIKLAAIIDDIQCRFSSQSIAPQKMLTMVEEYERHLLTIFSEIEPSFRSRDLNTYSAMALVLLRLYYHMAHIHLYLMVISLMPYQISVDVFNLRHKAMESACAITFITESMNVDFFKFSSSLKSNSTVLAFTVHRIASKSSDPHYDNLGGFGKERSVVTNLRNLNYRLGLSLPCNVIEGLMVDFSTPPKTNPLRVDLFI